MKKYKYFNCLVKHLDKNITDHKIYDCNFLAPLLAEYNEVIKENKILNKKTDYIVLLLSVVTGLFAGGFITLLIK